MKSSAALWVALLVAGCSDGDSPPVTAPTSIGADEGDFFQERLDELICTTAGETNQGALSNCESGTGVILTVVTTDTGCAIGPGAMQAPRWGHSLERCMPDLIWREDSGIPVAVVYRVSEHDDDADNLARGYYRGRWIITTVAQPGQESCVTHNIGGIGSREVVLRELDKLVLPYACSDRFTLIDVN
ncbi:MAG: hypothetical protein Q8L84_13440 [Hyphomonas sp.]|nr:hypothetical protein [Hyphomonas sp.]